MLPQYGSHKEGNSSEGVDTIEVTGNFTDCKILEQGGVLVDTPGAELAFAEDKSTEENLRDARRAVNILRDMHLVVFVERADQIGSQNSQVFFSENIRQLRPLNVVNMKDKYDLDAKKLPEDAEPLEIERCKERELRQGIMKSYAVNLERTLCVSCKEAKDAREDKEHVDQQALELSNIPELERRILQDLESLKPEQGVYYCLSELQKILGQLELDEARKIFNRAIRPFYMTIHHQVSGADSLVRIRDVVEKMMVKFFEGNRS